MRTLPSYVRRSLEMLDWIATCHPEAQVQVRGTVLGIWRGLAPRWQLDGNRICLRLGLQNGCVRWRIRTVRRTPWGATIAAGETGRELQEMDIVWHQTAPAHKTQIRRLPEAVRRWLRSLLPGFRIEKVSCFSDRAHTLSGSYFRVKLKQGNSDHLLLLGTAASEPIQASAILTQGLLWLIHLESKAAVSGEAPTLHLLVPREHAAEVCHRSQFVNSDRVKIEVWGYRDCGSDEWEIKRPPAPVAPVEERDFRWPVLGPFRWSALLERVMSLAPAAIQRYPRFRDYDSLRLWGLEFARVLGPERDRIVFGVGSQHAELTEENFGALKDLVEQILYFRRADSPATDHPYYRIQAERWLECLILLQVSHLFPELAPDSVYSQIPVYLGRIPGRIDILGSDRNGNLIVMELKVAEDPELPLQSLDYWGRVIGHNLNGDFERRGYFAGIRLSRARPKLYLVSPVFSFHNSLEKVMRFLSPDLEISKISVNEDWRCGIRIMRRIDCKCCQM
jgi:hypothetical protein